MPRLTLHARIWPEAIRVCNQNLIFSFLNQNNSTQLSMKFIILINVKMLTIIGHFNIY